MQKRLTFPTSVAPLIDMHEKTLRDWCCDGRIPTIKIGRDYMIPRSWLEEFIRKAGGDPDKVLALFEQVRTRPAIARLTTRDA